jgi:hypothetical protein
MRLRRLNALIIEARAERRAHHDARRFVEAAASAIRERALLEAKLAIEEEDRWLTKPRTLRDLGWRVIIKS